MKRRTKLAGRLAKRMAMRRMARGLGWFSIGLGLAELIAARRIGRAIGLEGRSTMLRAFGAREIGAGIGLLRSERKSPWLWARVGGDALDLAGLGFALRRGHRRGFAAAAAASVAGITALDVLSARWHMARA